MTSIPRRLHVLIDPPADWQRDVEAGAVAALADRPATTAADYYLRGLARVSLGRIGDARNDFTAANDVGPVAELERLLCCYLLGEPLEELLAALDAMPQMTGAVDARALHLRGLFRGRSGDLRAAQDALLAAEAGYRAVGDRVGLVQVLDSRGTNCLALGDVDGALHALTMSLVGKQRIDDRWGQAITLGNLGRAHLRQGHWRAALDCFEADAELAEELADRHGVVRMAAEIGRTRVLSGDLSSGLVDLEGAAEQAIAAGENGIAFFTAKDLALAHGDRGDLKQARHWLDQARQWADDRQVFQAELLELVACRLADRAGEDVCVRLEELCKKFEAAGRVDETIEAMIILARQHDRTGERERAEAVVRQAMRQARSGGYARFQAQLTDALLRLGHSGDEAGTRALCFGASVVAGDDLLVRDQLGSGAFGTVYRVWDARRGIELAVKTVRLDDRYDLKKRQCLLATIQAETSIADRLHHPGLCRVHGVGPGPDGGWQILQEYIPGPSLADAMARSSEQLDQRLAMLAQLAQALAALHGAGLIHRDLKPANVLLRDGREPVVVDYGLAALAGMDAGGRVAGTLVYMAPEQLRGRRLETAADCFALGAIAYEWLGGRRLLTGRDVDALMAQIKRSDWPDLQTLQAGVPQVAVTVINGLLDFKPRRRPTADEAAQVFAAAARCVAPTPDAVGGSDTVSLPPTQL